MFSFKSHPAYPAIVVDFSLEKPINFFSHSLFPPAFEATINVSNAVLWQSPCH